MSTTIINTGVLDAQTRAEAWENAYRYQSDAFGTSKDKDTRLFVLFPEVEKEIDERIAVVEAISDGENIKTWEMEAYLHRRGKLATPRLPVWKQIEQDCTAVSSAGAIQKVSIKDVALFQNEERILTPSPIWLYALARNQIARGTLRNIPGCTMTWVTQAIHAYGILYEELAGIGYTPELLKAWNDTRWVRQRPPYFDYLPRAKTFHITQIKCRTAAEVAKVIRGGGAATIVSDRDVVAPTSKDGLRDWMFSGKPMHHMMYFSDFERRGRVKGDFLFRWQIWGEDDLPEMAKTPAGGAWQAMEALDEEMRRPYVEVMGYMAVIGPPSAPDFNLVKAMADTQVEWA